jgi:hypothetical protein
MGEIARDRGGTGIPACTETGVPHSLQTFARAWSDCSHFPHRMLLSRVVKFAVGAKTSRR